MDDEEEEVGSDSSSTSTTLQLAGNCEIVRMETVGKHYLILICRSVHSADDATAAADDDAVDGQWFEPPEARTDTTTIEAVLVHVPTRRELERIRLGDDNANNDLFCPSFQYDLPVFVAANEEFMAVGLSWQGILLTGSAVQRVSTEEREDAEHHGNGDNNNPSSATKKKKKGQRKAKGGKKDGFARGCFSHKGN